ncbi:MAG: DUF3333 domain-containing protein [Rhizobium rhizophilum]
MRRRRKTPIQPKSILAPDARTRRRNASEARFRLMGLIAVTIGVLTLVGLLTSILSNGLSSFRQSYISLDVNLDAARLDKEGTRDPANIAKVSTFGYLPLIETALADAMSAKGIAIDGMNAKAASEIISKEAPASLRNYVIAKPTSIGETVTFNLLAAGRMDGYYKGRVTMESAALDRNTSPEHLQLADRLKKAGVLVTKFNWDFFTAPDASDTRPEAAGLGVAILGSAYMMLIVLVLSLPLGVAASIYLDEFAPQNWFTDLIEVNIANLAAVPSIVFGILGLTVFINYVGLPQSAPVVGGLVLTLMTLPTIIIATRAALKAVPPSIRDAALGVGASKMQSIFHHVLPLAMPGIMTGTIIGLAQTHRVHRKSREVRLGPTEFRLLEFLMASPGRVYSRSQLLDGVWGHDIYVDERTVDVHVGRLRKALNFSNMQDVIRTVRGAGYSMEA